MFLRISSCAHFTRGGGSEVPARGVERQAVVVVDGDKTVVLYPTGGETGQRSHDTCQFWEGGLCIIDPWFGHATTRPRKHTRVTLPINESPDDGEESVHTRLYCVHHVSVDAVL